MATHLYMSMSLTTRYLVLNFGGQDPNRIGHERESWQCCLKSHRVSSGIRNPKIRHPRSWDGRAI
ncbi:hypothetical protein PENSUB_6588 [Penicillium subrubescens]|uniref:Uncharacterized protein n=1 Tax=Penicillium subrubescens TaxID=1316194 RepID=A0A1Q5U066_9EURO|nr:hypothetical protein PENSUB_6588 [Penicillium subrubescens]